MSEGRFYHGIKLLPIFSLTFILGYYLLAFWKGFWYDFTGLVVMMLSVMLFLCFFRLRLKKKRFITQNLRHLEPSIEEFEKNLNGAFKPMDILEFEEQNRRLPETGVVSRLKVYGLDLFGELMLDYPFLSTRLDEKTVTLVFKGMEIHLTDPKGVYVQADRMILLHADVLEIEVRKKRTGVFGIDFIKAEDTLRVVRYTKERNQIHFPGFNAGALEIIGDFSDLMSD